MNNVEHYDHHSRYKIETVQDTYYCNHWEYVVCEDYYSQRLKNGYMCTPHIVFQDRSCYWYLIECSEVNVILEWVDGAYR